MGGVTQICSDKTGTLSQNVMTVIASHLAGVSFDKNGPGAHPAMNPKGLFYKLTTHGISLNCTAYIVPPKKKGGKPDFIGPKTECALLIYGEKLGNDYSALRKQIPIVVVCFSSPFFPSSPSLTYLLICLFVSNILSLLTPRECQQWFRLGLLA